MTGTAAIASNRRWRIRLRAPRFGLRGLLAATAVCAAACGWFVHCQRQVLARRVAIDAIYAAKGFASFEHTPGPPRRDGRCGHCLPQSPPGPAWLRSMLGYDFFARMGGVMLYECHGVDDLLCRWDSLADMQSLDLGSSDITDRGLISLPPLPRLTWLQLDGTAISDAGLARLSDFRELWNLDLAQTNVSSAGLAHLCDLSNLAHLNLSHTAVDDEGLALVGRMKGLYSLNLSSTKTTERGLRHIARMTQLVSLNLGDSAVTGSGLAELQTLSNLTDLHFSPGDSADLAHLSSLPQIETLHLTGPGVSDLSIAYVLRFAKLKSLSLERTQVGWLGLAFVLAFGPEDFETDTLEAELDSLFEWLDSPLVLAANDTLLIDEIPTLSVVFTLTELLLADGRSDAET